MSGSAVPETQAVASVATEVLVSPPSVILIKTAARIAGAMQTTTRAAHGTTRYPTIP